MKRQKGLRKLTPTDLWSVLQEVWNRVPSKGTDAGLKAKGGHTEFWLDFSFVC